MKKEMNCGFFRLEQTGTEKGKHCFFRCFLAPVSSYGRETLVGTFLTADEAVEAMMNPFNSIYMEDLEDLDFLNERETYHYMW